MFILFHELQVIGRIEKVAIIHLVKEKEEMKPSLKILKEEREEMY